MVSFEFMVSFELKGNTVSLFTEFYPWGVRVDRRYLLSLVVMSHGRQVVKVQVKSCDSQSDSLGLVTKVHC